MLSLDESIERKSCKLCMMYVIYGLFFLVCEKDEFKEKV